MSIDIAALLGDQGVQYDYKSRDWINITCPIPDCDDTTDHGGFNLPGGYYHCWKCGGHEMDYVLKHLLGLSYSEVKSLIFQYSGRASVLYSLKEPQKSVKKIDLPGGPLKSVHKKYLRSRGFDPSLIESKYKVQGTGPAGDYKLRLIVPIIYTGKVVSFLGRDVTNKQKLRYRNLPRYKSRIPLNNILYNLDNCTYSWVAVVEGVFDVWRMGDGFCCSFGTEMTEHQIKLLNGFEKIYFVFDSERKAQARAERYAAQLSSLGREVIVVDIESDNDPAELSDRRAQRLRKRILRL